MMPPTAMIDLGIASLIVAFSSSITYGIIQWLRRAKKT